MTLPWKSPETIVPSPATSRNTAPRRNDVRNASPSSPGWRIIRQRLTPATTAPPTMKQAKIVCGNVASTTGLVMTAMKSVSSARPVSALNAKPTGFCMNEFAARMK